MRSIGTAEHAWVLRPTSHLRLTAAHHHHWSIKGTATTLTPIQSQKFSDVRAIAVFRRDCTRIHPWSGQPRA
jgi:hypothetical protein